MNDETREKLQNLIAWLYDNEYIDNNEIGMIINYTDKGSKFIKDQLGNKWDTNWNNFCCDDSIWLPYPNVYNIGDEIDLREIQNVDLSSIEKKLKESKDEIYQKIRHFISVASHSFTVANTLIATGSGCSVVTGDESVGSIVRKLCSIHLSEQHYPVSHRS